MIIRNKYGSASISNNSVHLFSPRLDTITHSSKTEKFQEVAKHKLDFGR